MEDKEYIERLEYAITEIQNTYTDIVKVSRKNTLLLLKEARERIAPQG